MADYQETFQPVFDRIGFEPAKTFREGPRFYVVGGGYRGKRAVFKADVEEGPRRLRKARWRTRREAIFLEYAGIKHIPEFYEKGVRRKFFWFLEGWVSGESQEMGGSTFLVKETFFTERNMEFLLEFLTELHRLGGKSIPQFEAHLPRYTLADYMNFIWSDRGHLLGKDLAEEAAVYLKSRHRLFNINQTVVAHHELYGPHIFVAPDQFSVIDWENVGWGNLAHDFVSIWIRSFAHPDFQSELLKRFRAKQKAKEVFDQLFRLEVILQGVGNIRFFKYAKAPEEKLVADEVSDFLRENLEKAVSA